MSILIKGTEMPTNHPLWIIVHPDGTIETNEVSASRPVGWQTLQNSVVSVPPHGNLIEKHDVFKMISAFPEIDKLLTVEFMTALYNLPTIIPAEENK